jgi:hypothetical protein
MGGAVCEYSSLMAIVLKQGKLSILFSLGEGYLHTKPDRHSQLLPLHMQAEFKQNP